MTIDQELRAAADELLEVIEHSPVPLLSDPQHGDDLMVDYLQQRPDESDASAERKGWSGVVVAVAATILVVVGVVVVADGNSDEAATDSSSPASMADPSLSLGVADPVPYQWSRVPHDEAVFGGAGGQAMSSVTVGGPGPGGRRSGCGPDDGRRRAG